MEFGAYQRVIWIITWLRDEYDGYCTTPVILHVGVDVPGSTGSTGIVEDVGCSWAALSITAEPNLFLCTSHREPARISRFPRLRDPFCRSRELNLRSVGTLKCAFDYLAKAWNRLGNRCETLSEGEMVEVIGLYLWQLWTAKSLIYCH